MLPSLKSEPVVYLGAAGGIVSAIVVAIAAFVHLTQDQLNAIGGVLLILVPPVLAFIQRQFVTPVKDATGSGVVSTPSPPPPLQ